MSGRFDTEGGFVLHPGALVPALDEDGDCYLSLAPGHDAPRSSFIHVRIGSPETVRALADMLRTFVGTITAPEDLSCLDGGTGPAGAPKTPTPTPRDVFGGER